MFIINIKRFLIFIAVPAVISCNYGKVKEKNDSDFSPVLKGDTLVIPEGSSILSRLKADTVRAQEFNFRFTTTGIIKPMPGMLAEVSTPFEGRVMKSFVKLGNRVNAGAPLFEVNSSEYLDAIKMYLQTRKERDIKEKNFLRKKELHKQGLVSVKELDEAGLESEFIEKEFEKSLATLRIFNPKPDEADLIKPLVVRSPIGGEIVRNNIILGQFLKSDADPVVTVADLNKIWVIAHVKEKDLSKITLQSRVEVYTESYPDSAMAGKVTYIGDLMEENTRSVEVYIECENQSRRLKPGMFVTTHFFQPMTHSLLIPSSAVFQEEDKSVCYLRHGKGIYLKRNLTVSDTDGKTILVHSGIAEGDVIISEGAIYLR